MRRTAALIVGGGPAGSAAAIALARGGLRPLLVERTAEPHDVVCGGFLGWDALAALERLGIDAPSLGAPPIGRLRLASARDTLEAPLPGAAAGLSRRTLDEALLRQAAGAGVEVVRGRAARAADPSRRTVRFEDGEYRADALLLATGKHELRGAARAVDLAGRPIGLRTALPASAARARALDGAIELHLFDGGYAGLLLQEDGTANLCLSVSARRFKAAGGIGRLLEQLTGELPLLRDRVEDALPGAAWSAVSGVPYGWSTNGTADGCYRLGDQAAVIASLAGDGIGIALESGRHAAAAILAGTPAPAYQAGFAKRAARPVGVAEALRWSAERPLPRATLMRLLGWFPGVARGAARLTRIGAA
ncbi:MAG TPA: FAD-dependent oxidoreductase [Allosphingosinicella sp.]